MENRAFGAHRDSVHFASIFLLVEESMHNGKDLWYWIDADSAEVDTLYSEEIWANPRQVKKYYVKGTPVAGCLELRQNRSKRAIEQMIKDPYHAVESSMCSVEIRFHEPLAWHWR